MDIRPGVSADDVPLALLVDRDADTRQMYAEYLRQAAYDIDEAEDGREALAKAISRRPDVIVTETRLPGMDGFHLCLLLRRDEATREIPIVVVTADAFAADVDRAHQAGADAVLVKPCLPDHLAQAIREVRESAHALRRQAQRPRTTAIEQVALASDVIERSHATLERHHTLRKAHHRHETVTPPTPAPALRCPRCDQPLVYQTSHVGGVSARQLEQWDYFECPQGCGTYQYRQRTRKLRRV